MSGAGDSVVAALVSVVAKVELEPETPDGSAPRFEAKAPPLRWDSAASESDATAPAPSVVGLLVAGSLVF